MRMTSRLTRRLCSALVPVILVVVAEGVASACAIGLRAATAEEQRFYADALAMFQEMAPPAPAHWTATDEDHPTVSNGVLTEVCARPNERVLYASFARSYALASQEVLARQAELARRLALLLQQQQAAADAGKPVDWAASDAERAKLGADAQRDTTARFMFSVGHPMSIPDTYTPVPAPVGRGYRQVTNNEGELTEDLVIVLNPGTPAKSGLKVVTIVGDPARVAALVKAARFQ